MLDTGSLMEGYTARNLTAPKHDLSKRQEVFHTNAIKHARLQEMVNQVTQVSRMFAKMKHCVWDIINQLGVWKSVRLVSWGERYTALDGDDGAAKVRNLAWPPTRRLVMAVFELDSYSPWTLNV